MEETTMLKKTLALATLALGLVTAGAFAAQSAQNDQLWIHIHVKDGKDSNVSINLPISMVEKMAQNITTESEGESRLRFNDEEVTVAELREMWNELRRQPDATFITVDDDVSSKVRVAKQGGYLIVRSREDRAGKTEDVEMKIPGTVVDALLSAPGEKLDVAAALRALARHGEGELVTVNGTGETVRIWVDESSESR
jgi:hypothetical protein